MFTVAKAILEVLTVLQELNVIAQRLITVLGTAAVKLAHRSVGSRHKIFSDFREIRSIKRSGQQLFGMWPSYPSSTPGCASCILFQIFHKISFFSYLRYFWLCTTSLFFIQQYIVAKTSQLLTEIQTTVNSSPVGLTLGKVG